MRHRWLILVALVALLCSVVLLAAQAAPPPLRQVQTLDQAPLVASYTLDVTLDPSTKVVRGQGTLTYTNPSADTLNEVWLRLYLKAFSATDTLWMRESGGSHRGFSAKDAHGDIQVTALSMHGGADLLASSTVTDTLLRAPLPAPLAPGQQLVLDMSWESQLPRVFARTGFGGRNDSFFMVGQWYPKMAVYDRGRWDTEPWHTNSEFFNDFGRYEVTITAPAAYQIAATGVSVGEPESAGELRRHHFVAEQVSDFAFAASPDFQIHTASVGPTEVKLFLLPEHAGNAQRYLDVAVDALTTFGAWYGPYPHPRLTVVDVPANAGGAGGMEYPTLVTGEGDEMPLSSGYNELVLAHEIGHQWWPMQTATNEGLEPWLDEGLTEYSGARMIEATGRSLKMGGVLSAPALDLALYASGPAVRSNLPAWKYGDNYAIGAYAKPAVGLTTLERVVGSERFRSAMATYLREWRFRHPTSSDFRAVLERELGPLDWFFDDFIAGEGQIGYRALPITDDSVVIERTGAVRVPVEVLVRFASGGSQTYHLDGAEARVTLEPPAGERPVSVVVDPAQKLYGELDRLDNTTGPTSVVPSIIIGARLSFWVQMIVQTLGLFG